jgi:hypothetical protein
MEKINMSKDVATRTNRNERMPVSRRANVFTPWFEDFIEPTRLLDVFFSRDLSPIYGNNRFLPPAIDIDETSNEL